MLREQNIHDAVYPAYETVKAFLLSESGLKVQEHLSTLDLMDFVFNENGYDRFHDKCPESDVYDSTITHFGIYLADYLDIDAYRKDLNATMPQLSQDPNSIDGELFETNRKAIEYLFLVLNRREVINNTLLKVTQVNTSA